jgi:hypothetical protein
LITSLLQTSIIPEYYYCNSLKMKRGKALALTPGSFAGFNFETLPISYPILSNGFF